MQINRLPRDSSCAGRNQSSINFSERTIGGWWSNGARVSRIAIPAETRRARRWRCVRPVCETTPAASRGCDVHIYIFSFLVFSFFLFSLFFCFNPNPGTSCGGYKKHSFVFSRLRPVHSETPLSRTVIRNSTARLVSFSSKELYRFFIFVF